VGLLARSAEPLLSLLFPSFCAICRAPVEPSSLRPACARCWSQTRIFSSDDALCAKCGEFLRAGPLGEGRALCGRCSHHHYDRAAAGGKYEGALAAAVIALKSAPDVSERSREILCDTFERAACPAVSVIIPVPLSERRLRERGYNQAELLGRLIEKRFSVPLDAYTLRRVRHSPIHRAAMDRRGRELTVEKAFEVKRPKLVADRSVLLVDDVLTTGATVSSCAGALKKAGAGEVFVLTLARA
jgi:ComF family protein